MKRLLSTLLLCASLIACQKEELPTGTNGVHASKLGVELSGAYKKSPLTVEIVAYDYVNGHTPMTQAAYVSYDLTDINTNWWQDRINTMLPYEGAINVIVTSKGSQDRYSKYILLTDSIGAIVNLDTTQKAIAGIVADCHLADVVPKLHL
jgi:hypothetical protein